MRTTRPDWRPSASGWRALLRAAAARARGLPRGTGGGGDPAPPVGGAAPHLSRALLQEQFQREIFPLVTPRAITVSPGFPVPVMPHLNPLIAVMLHDGQTGPAHFAYLRLPDRIPRFLPVPDSNDLILAGGSGPQQPPSGLPRRRIEGAWLFRLTRAAELDLSDEDAGQPAPGDRGVGGPARAEPHRAGRGRAGDAAAAARAAPVGAALRARGGRRARCGSATWSRSTACWTCAGCAS